MTTVADLQVALKDIKDDIDTFNVECESREHTDIGDAWDLFGSIHRSCETELKNIIDTENKAVAPTVEIQQVICLSTAHVTDEDMNARLSEECSSQPVFSAPHEYGAFVYIPQEKTAVLELVEAALEFGYSESFAKVLRFGCAHKARYIHLDADGPQLVWAVERHELDIRVW